MKAWKRLPGTPDPMYRWKGEGGVSIAGDSWGNADGPLVLLQHGGGQTRHAWKDAGERLGAAGYFAVALDARGHGDSDWAPDGDYSQDATVADLICILEALACSRPVLVGASMGGLTSLVAVGEGRVDAAALVLVDVAARLEIEGVGEILAFMEQNSEGFDSLEEVAQAISDYQPHRPKSGSTKGLAKNLRLDERGKYRWHFDPQFHRVRDLKKRQARSETCARNLSVPTLLVRGALSNVVSEQGADEFRSLCPQAEYVNVNDAGHMIAGDQNDAFAEAVIEFLSRAVPTKNNAPPRQP